MNSKLVEKKKKKAILLAAFPAGIFCLRNAFSQPGLPKSYRAILHQQNITGMLPADADRVNYPKKYS